MADVLNLDNGQRAQRKLLITVAEWNEGTTETPNLKREILGRRVEDSSIELNPDIETTTDILGITYTDVNKTEPQQSLDPSYIIGGSNLATYMSNAMLQNDIDKWNQRFDVYIISAFISFSSGGDTSYRAVKHRGCSIIPTSIGGDSYVGMPLEIHFSNDIVVGKVDSLSDDFEFTAD